MYTNLSAKLIAVTQPIEGATEAKDAEDIISYCARVSNPGNQENYETAGGLLAFCIRNKHWSIFEMANAVVEIEAPRDITRQILRHGSMNFQEFSQRYSDEIDFTFREVRMQDYKNRQNSLDTVDDELKEAWESGLSKFVYGSEDYTGLSELYREAIDSGVAKECARVILPEGLTMSRLYVNGNVRSWLHYLEVREGNGTQKEHVLLANKIREALEPAFPTIMGLANAS